MSEMLEGPLTDVEVYNVLKTMKNNKSPGQDGFTVEFYCFFWNELNLFMVKSLNYAYAKGEMSFTIKLGIISLIPKGNKNRDDLKNWRPISLLNVLSKFATGCIANGLKKVLSYLIHENQKGFLKGRYIGENIRLYYTILCFIQI